MANTLISTLPPTTLQTSRRRSALQSGFTLIEIMVVVIILAVLAAVVVPNFLSKPNEARVAVAQNDIRTIRQALQLYYLDNGAYPSTEQGLMALTVKPATGSIPSNWKPYLPTAPKDPWGNPYQYRSPGQNGEVDIYSFGANGPGANEEAIVSWKLN